MSGQEKSRRPYYIFACGFVVKIEDFWEFCSRRKKLEDILNVFGKNVHQSLKTSETKNIFSESVYAEFSDKKLSDHQRLSP